MRGARSTRRRSVAIGLVVPVIFAACGDGDGGAATTVVTTQPSALTTTSTTPPTTTEPVPPTATGAPSSSTTSTVPPATTLPPTVQPTWGPPAVWAATGSDTPFSGPPYRTEFASSSDGVVALRPTSVEDDEEATSIWFSADALAWESAATIDGARLRTLVAGGPGFVAVGSAGSDVPGSSTPIGVMPYPLPAVWTSADGRAWSPAASIDIEPFAFAEIDDVAVGGDGLVAVGEAWDRNGERRSAVWTSRDGLSWTIRAGDPFDTSPADVLLQVAAGVGGVVVVVTVIPPESTGPGPMSAWWSADGVDWQQAPEIDSFTDGSAVADVVAFGGGFVMAGSRAGLSALAWTSVDGRTWTDPVVLPVRSVTDSTILFGLVTDGATLIAYGDDVVFGEGTDPAIGDVAVWMSFDGVEWEHVPPESLRTGELPDGVELAHALRLGSEWVLLGGAWDPDSDTGVGVAWFGRTDA